MKKLILTAAVASAFFAPQAFAQSKNFEGFSAGLSANFNNIKFAGSGGTVSDRSTTTGIRAAYGWAISNKFILSLGASYDMNKAKVFSDASAEITAQDTTVLSIEPGYKMTDTALVYAKLGYATTKGVQTGSSARTDNFTGIAYGLGARSMLNKNWSADLEFQQINFAEKNGGNSSATVTTIGVNYHF